MRQIYLIWLVLLNTLLGCASLPADNASFDWKQVGKAHEEAQKTGICEIHKIKMTLESVPIRWGEATPPAPGDPSYQYRMENFPNYTQVIEGGCVKIPGKNSKMTFICSLCKGKAIAWKNIKI